MPSLRSIADVDELDNRYIDKYVIYVEGESDQTVWERIVGPNVADRIEFKVPSAAGSGYTLVCQRVAQERPHNAKIFGLIDGEVAATHSRVDRLIASVEPIFVLDIPTLDGILFLAEHETENILLRFSKMPDYILHDCSIANAGERNLSAIEEELLRLSCRFFVAALFKYASAHLKAREGTGKTLNVDRFRGRESTHAVIQTIKHTIATEHQIDPAIVVREVRSIMKLFRGRVKGEAAEVRKREIMRLAEGKGLFIAIKNRWNITPTCEGHLLKEVTASDFAGEFRERLLELTVHRAVSIVP